MRTARWTEYLDVYIEEKRLEPFIWGKNDCCLFASNWVLIATGLDPAYSLKNTYNSALSAARIIKNCNGMEGIIKKHAQWLIKKSIQFAIRGDIIIKDCGMGDCMGIILGSYAAFVSKEGLVFHQLPKDNNVFCWTF